MADFTCVSKGAPFATALSAVHPASLLLPAPYHGPLHFICTFPTCHDAPWVSRHRIVHPEGYRINISSRV
jgi:hypothetical protein